MYEVVNIDIQDTGIYASMPWLAKIVVSITGGLFVDSLIARKCMSVSMARKSSLFICKLNVNATDFAHFNKYALFIFDSAANIMAIFIVAASYAGCDRFLLSSFFFVAIGTRGFLSCSLYANPMDLSPNYSGAITSIANGIGAIIGVLVPYIIGLLTPNVSHSNNPFQ